jgi:hypothetical protein
MGSSITEKPDSMEYVTARPPGTRQDKRQAAMPANVTQNRGLIKAGRTNYACLPPADRGAQKMSDAAPARPPGIEGRTIFDISPKN